MESLSGAPASTLLFASQSSVPACDHSDTILEECVEDSMDSKDPTMHIGLMFDPLVDMLISEMASGTPPALGFCQTLLGASWRLV